MKKSSLVLSLLLILLSLNNCSFQKSAALQPGKQPYKSKIVKNLVGDNIVLADLDGNGFTEIITVNRSFVNEHPGSFLMLMTFEGKVIEQINYPGRIIDGVMTLDYNNDGVQEILVPYVRNDSLFISFVDARGEKLFYFFLIDGNPRIEDSGSFDWDPSVRNFYIRDLDHDGVKELITVITTGYAQLPRGILVNSLLDGSLIGKSIIGTSPRETFLDDFDDDGQEEILCLGMAPNNGAKAGGFDDRYSYLILYDLKPAPQLADSQKICQKYSNYVLFYDNFDDDASKELIAWTESYSERVIETKIVELDPIRFKEVKKRSFNSYLKCVTIANLNRDIQHEFVVLQSENKIAVLNSNFDEIKISEFPLNLNSVKSLPDVDNDGIDEIVVGSIKGDFLLNSDLKIKAHFSSMQCLGVIKRGGTLAPQIVVRDQNHYALVQLIKNRFYLVKRFYAIFLYFIFGAILIASLIFVTQLRRQNGLFAGVQSLTFDSDSRGLLLFDVNQKIHKINHTLCQWIAIPDLDKKNYPRLSGVFSRFPEILTFLEDAIREPTHRYERTMTMKGENHNRIVQIIVDPVPIKNRIKKLLLVTFVDKAVDNHILQAQTWCKMAQKTAHDIKNPLSAIMLTLQRLQQRLKERFPQVIEEFDSHFARIIERIDTLRRISKNFMKFVNVDALNFVNTDLKDFLNDSTATICPGLPPDIQLNLQTDSELPRIKIDPEAMHSVIENLISNAVNAMPEGGAITISAQSMPGITIPGNGQVAKDYVLIEVLDTGIGIPSTDQELLFKPDFTNTENGNGLGLAYVKKIVVDHGGYIEVESEPGAGAAFCIYLPTL